MGYLMIVHDEFYVYNVQMIGLISPLLTEQDRDTPETLPLPSRGVQTFSLFR